jgi:hypothetical protein
MPSLSRLVAMSALVGATILAAPLTAIAADSAPPAATQAVPPTATQVATRETVEQRITSLHASLAITPAEEADWNGVSTAMRQSAAVMDKLVAEKSAIDPAKMTAVEDLMTYEKFARAHVEGLKSLTHSFAVLYKAMPDAQKKVADEVFQNFGHEKSAAHG